MLVSVYDPNQLGMMTFWLTAMSAWLHGLWGHTIRWPVFKGDLDWRFCSHHWLLMRWSFSSHHWLSVTWWVDIHQWLSVTWSFSSHHWLSVTWSFSSHQWLSVTWSFSSHHCQWRETSAVTTDFMSLYSSNSDKDAKHTKTRIRSRSYKLPKRCQNQNTDSSPMLSGLDLNCRLYCHIAVDWPKGKRREKSNVRVDVSLLLALVAARYRRAEEEYRRLRRPYLCHRCRWKIFQLLCLPCEHMVCFGCVVFTWPWCPVCSAFIEDPVNIQFAS